jgi:hypothetical protein
MKLIALTVLAVAASAPMSLTYQDDLGRVVIMDAPCHKEVLQHLPPAVHDSMQGAEYTGADGTHMRACWVMVDDKHVYIHFADNDKAVLKLEKFNKGV